MYESNFSTHAPNYLNCSKKTHPSISMIYLSMLVKRSTYLLRIIQITRSDLVTGTRKGFCENMGIELHVSFFEILFGLFTN